MKKSIPFFKGLSTLVFILSIYGSNPCMAQITDPDAKDIEIKILKDYDFTKSDSLVLDKKDTVIVYKGKKVKWILGSEAKNVKKFTIETKPNYNNPYTLFGKPSGAKKKIKTGNIQSKTDQTYYEYSIIWDDTNGKEHTFDPKISIKPSIIGSPYIHDWYDFIYTEFFPVLMMGFVIGLLTFFSILKIIKKFKDSPSANN